MNINPIANKLFQFGKAIMVILVLALLMGQVNYFQLWPLEVLVSFLPYVLICYILFAAILLFASSDLLIRRGEKIKAIKLTALIIAGSLVFIQIPLFYFARPVGLLSGSTYSSLGLTKNEDKIGKNLRVAFFNKKFSNTSYTVINKALVEVNSDIIGFAEISEQDIAALPELKNYPYRLSSLDGMGSQTSQPVLIALFSKYELTKVEPSLSIVFPVIQATVAFNTRYSANVILVHTTAPISQSYLLQRNAQLTALAKHVATDNLNGFYRQPTTIMGDFNLSPWSGAYSDFLYKINSANKSAASQVSYTNAAHGRGIKSTWAYQDAAIASTQIDHIFSNVGYNNMSGLTTYDSVDLGSDHKLIYTDLSI